MYLQGRIGSYNHETKVKKPVNFIIGNDVAIL